MLTNNHPDIEGRKYIIRDLLYCIIYLNHSASSLRSSLGPCTTIKRKSLSGAIKISCNFDFSLKNDS